MTERGGTNLLFIIGLGLIILAVAVYALAAIAGISFAIGEATEETGAPIFLILLVPGLALLGFILLFIKVVADRLGSKEDNHYSRTVDK